MKFTARLVAAVVALAVLAPRAQAVEWRSWNSGLSAAASARRPVLVDVYTDWCRWCKQMDRDVYGRSDIAQYLSSHFVTVRLNAEGGELVSYQGRNMSARSLASSFDVSGYPTTIFLTAEGDRLVNVPGYVGPDRFLLLLRYIGDGYMERGVKWEDYAKRPDARPAP